MNVVLLILAIVGAALVIYLLHERSWVALAAVLVCSCFTYFFGLRELRTAVLDMHDQSRRAAQIAESMAKMLRFYETNQRYDESDARLRAGLRPVLIDACRDIVKIGPTIYGYYQIYDPGVPQEFNEIGDLEWKSFPLDWDVEGPAVLAAIRLAEESADRKDRARAYEVLVLDHDNASGAYDSDRLSRKFPRNGLGHDVMDLMRGANPMADRLMAYAMSGVYARKHDFARATDKLKAALGDDWFATGRVDKLWASRLPPRPEDHRYFGRVLLGAGYESQALREFRASGWPNADLDEMRRFYRSQPDPLRRKWELRELSTYSSLFRRESDYSLRR